MFKTKKAQGLSLNIVIIAVIVLIVLVVLAMVFTGKIKFFGKGVSDTSSQFTSGTTCEVAGTSNTCMYSEDECSSKGGIPKTSDHWDDPDGCDVCCIM